MTSIRFLCRKSDAGASHRPPVSMTMSIRKPPVGVKGHTVFYFVADKNPLQKAGNRMDQRLVLVYLCAGAVAQACMLRDGVRRTTS